MAPEFDRRGLVAFLRQGEGQAPPVCVGRAALLDTLGQAARDRAGTPKNTQILQGAPGAGKSTILTEMLKRCTEGGVWAKTGLRVVVLQSSHLIESMESVITVIREAAAPDPGRWRQRVKGWLERMDFGIQTIGVGVQEGLRAPEPVNTFSDLTSHHPAPPDAPSLIVAIDEAQGIPVEEGSDHNAFLMAIHGGRLHMPTTLVLAGLGDTKDRARRVGLTRGLTVHPVGALPPGDDVALMTGFCVHFGVDAAGFEDRLEDLAAPCEGWPRHLHFALRALGREILATNEDHLAGPGSLDRVNWVQVTAETAASRIRYYCDQQSVPMMDSAALVGAVMQDLQDRHRRSHVINSINRHARTHPDDREWQIPKGMDADMLTDHLIHQGALQPTERKTVSAPIPSFRSYLVRDGTRLEVEALVAVDPVLPAPESQLAERIIAATEPHTEDEIVNWGVLNAAWQNHCSALAAVVEPAATLAEPEAVTMDAARAAVRRVISALDGPLEGPVGLAAAPSLPASLPHAERAVDVLAGKIKTFRTTARAILDGKDDSWCRDTFGDVMGHIDRALEASPEDQLTWAIHYLTGQPSFVPDSTSQS